MNKTAVFTIVSNNYLAYARTLMQSVAEVHPEWDRHLLLVDRAVNIQNYDGLFRMLEVEALPLPQIKKFLFRYGIMEMNTAAKPWMFEYLLKLKYQHVIYLDPDILVLDRLVDVERLLDLGANGVLTPHITAPLNDDKRPSELDIMRAGTFNLGFLALGNTQEAYQFVQWWQKKLEFFAEVDLARGLFTDQKWIDLVPGMFDGFKVLRDPGYNVAYWNIAHRPMTMRDKKWFSADCALRFFHFSGLNPEQPASFSKHQNRFVLDDLGVGKELAMRYASLLLENDHIELKKIPYAFSFFNDGCSIPEPIRGMYRSDVLIQERCGDDPFSARKVFSSPDDTGIIPALKALWERRGDLQRAYPKIYGKDYKKLFDWFIRGGGVLAGYSTQFVELIEAASMDLDKASKKQIKRSNLWGYWLETLHFRVTGVSPPEETIQSYYKVTSFLQFFKAAYSRYKRLVDGSSSSAMKGLLHRIFMHGYGRRSQSAPVKWKLADNSVPVLPNKIAGDIRRQWGVYPEANKCAYWLGQEAGFELDSKVVGQLKIYGVYHPDPINKVYGNAEMVVDIVVDGMKIDTIDLKSPGKFEISPNYLLSTTKEKMEIRIIPNRFFVPREIGLNHDSRKLSIQISKITVGDKVILLANKTTLPSQKGKDDQLVVSGINVIGYVLSEHGVGQSARLFSSALDAVKIPYLCVDFSIGNPTRCNDNTVCRSLSKKPTHDINVLHINADQMPVLKGVSSDWLDKRYNIGFWHWELPVFPDRFLSGFDDLNEVWTPSTFVQSAVSAKARIPVLKISHAIDFTVDKSLDRNHFRLPSEAFLFLLMYDFSSYQQRKNPQATLAAFDAAFKTNDADVQLVIKTQNSHLHPGAKSQLENWLRGRKNVIWIDQTFTRQETYNLVSVCDCYVSLHRSEGFGLGPAEAMFLGKPVIATAWSGNMEFMRQDNSFLVNYELTEIADDVGVYARGNVWADPDIHHAAELMKMIVNDKILRESISLKASVYMRKYHSPRYIGEQIRARLGCVGYHRLT